jgi:hypothetical protein
MLNDIGRRRGGMIIIIMNIIRVIEKVDFRRRWSNGSRRTASTTDTPIMLILKRLAEKDGRGARGRRCRYNGSVVFSRLGVEFEER